MSQRLYVRSENNEDTDEICLGKIVNDNYSSLQCINFLKGFVCGQNDFDSNISDNLDCIEGWEYYGDYPVDYKLNKMTIKLFIEAYYRDFPDRRNIIADEVNNFIETHNTFEIRNY